MCVTVAYPPCLTCLGRVDDEVIAEGGQPPLLRNVVRLHGFIVRLHTVISFVCFLKNRNINYSKAPLTPGALNQIPTSLILHKREKWPQKLHKSDVGPTGRLVSHGWWDGPRKGHTPLSDLRLSGPPHAAGDLDHSSARVNNSTQVSFPSIPASRPKVSRTQRHSSGGASDCKHTN